MAHPSSTVRIRRWAVASVGSLGGKGLRLISTAATGGPESFTGVKNSVPVVINDDLRNGADVTEGLATILLEDDSVTICG